MHHFARQLGSPFPLLAAVGARTKKIEIGTAVIDMRYENPMYMAEDAGAADIIAGGRLQLGISRGSPEQVIDGWRYFGYAPRDGETAADMARRHAEVFLDVLKGEGFAEPNPRPDVSQSAGAAAPRALFRRIARANLVGLEFQRDVQVGRETGHESPEFDAQRSTRPASRCTYSSASRLKPIVRRGRTPATGVSRACPSAAASSRSSTTATGRTSVATRDQDQVGYIDANTRAIFGRWYAAEPDVLVKELAGDEAIAAADTLLLTIPNQLGVDYNAHVLESILKYVAPDFGWR